MTEGNHSKDPAFDLMQTEQVKAEEKRQQLRFQFGLTELEAGKLQVLKSSEFTNALITWIVNDEEKDLRRKILIQVSAGATGEDSFLRERVLTVLSLCLEYSCKASRMDLISILSQGLYDWLVFENEILAIHSGLFSDIEKICKWLLNNGILKESCNIVVALRDIATGDLEKNTTIKNYSAKTLANIASRKLIQQLTDGFLLENENKIYFQDILLSFGEKAAIYQFNIVNQSQSKKERIALLHLLSHYGQCITPVLQDCLERNPPWAVVRNIIFLVSEIRNEELYHRIEKYFFHEDTRVQYEMVCCIVKLGGPLFLKRLIEGLRVVDDSLKSHLIRLLIERGAKDGETFTVLSETIQAKEKFLKGKNLALFRALLTALQYFPTQETISLLTDLLHGFPDDENHNLNRFYIQEVLNFLRPIIRHSEQHQEQLGDGVSFMDDQHEAESVHNKMREIESEIEKYRKSGQTNEAGKYIYNLSITAMHSGDFLLAEKLRDRLLEIDPMALSEVLELGEIIEENKNSGVTSHHIEIWGDLYEKLSSEEYQALYYGLKTEYYRKGEVLIQAGEFNKKLYFVNSGSVSLKCFSAGKELFLKKMKPSDVLGGEVFFTASVWTTTLEALTEVQVQLLDYPTYCEIVKEHPNIEFTLQKYCERYSHVPKLLQMSGEDRRGSPRYALSVVTQNLILDPFENAGKRTFRGELVDISTDGLAFTIRLAQKEIGNLLLGRQIISVLEDNGVPFVKCKGVIVGVRPFDPLLQNYSIHVKFTHGLEKFTLERIVSMIR